MCSSDLVQILLVHFAVMPALVHPESGLLLAGETARTFRQEYGAFFSGAVALSLNAGAYISEIFRAGIESIHRGQTQAAWSLGLTHGQAMRFVILPQAVRNVVPPLLNDFISLQKDVALVSVLGIVEAFRVAQIDAASTFNYTPLLAAASLYVIVTVPLSLFLDRLQRRDRSRRRLEEARR